MRPVPSGFVPVVDMPGVSFQSRLLGVVQPASGTVSDRPIAPGLGETSPPFTASVEVGVGHPASEAAPSRSIPPVWLGEETVFGPPLGVFGVGQPANFTACSKLAACFRPSDIFPVASIFSMSVDLPPLGVFGVGHPVNPLPNVVGPRAVCTQYRSPAGVTFSFQVCV